MITATLLAMLFGPPIQSTIPADPQPRVKLTKVDLAKATKFVTLTTDEPVLVDTRLDAVGVGLQTYRYDAILVRSNDILFSYGPLVWRVVQVQ